MLSLARSAPFLKSFCRGRGLRKLHRTAVFHCEKRVEKDEYDDFFGIEYDQQNRDEEPSMHVPTAGAGKPLWAEKRLEGLESSGQVEDNPDHDQSEHSMDQIVQMNFGTIRLDSMNLPRGQESTQEATQTADDLGFVDQQYFSELTRSVLRGDKKFVIETDNETMTTDGEVEEEEFDVESAEMPVMEKSLSKPKDELNYFDQILMNQDEADLGNLVANSSPVVRQDSPTTTKRRVVPTRDESAREQRSTNKQPREEITRDSTVKDPDHDQLEGTAFELSQQLRAEDEISNENLDSKGFINPRHQVDDLSQLPRHMLVSKLKHAIIYNDHDILAIDKPYGLPTQPGKGVKLSIDCLLPELASSLENVTRLYQVHRLDRDTTGVMIFAKTEAMQRQLIDLFRHHEVEKRYLVLTKGVPTPESGMIRIPLKEGTVQGRYRMTVAPDDPKMKAFGKTTSESSSMALTKYRVLDSRNSVALVECIPITGLKHQVRCHLAFGLDCPILGDHKYSHYNKLAPQRLYPETLQHLGIRQSKVRNLALHIHSSSIYLPDVIDGRYAFIRARLPEHFMESMKRLKIKLKLKK